MRKILIADDDAMTLRLVEFKLKQEGYAVLSARDGEKALKLAATEKPDLIILDFMMPVLDGLATLRCLKDSPELKAIPVIILTAQSKASGSPTGQELGAADYMVKPFSPVELAERVKKLLPATPPSALAS